MEPRGSMPFSQGLSNNPYPSLGNSKYISNNAPFTKYQIQVIQNDIWGSEEAL